MYANPRKTHSIRPLGPVDISSVREDLIAIPEEAWARENEGKPNRGFGALDQTQHIIFRFVSSFADWRQSFERPVWQDWRQRLEPILEAATRPYGYTHGAYPRIMLARMPAGAVIRPHVDAKPAARWPHKIHIPIQTNDDVRFFIAPDYHHLQVGQAYEVNNLTQHAVINGGITPRIHLIFEYYDVEQPIDES